MAISLPNVTLFSMDTTDRYQRTEFALDICEKDIDFGDVVFIDEHEGITNDKEVARWIANELVDYIDTDFVLCIQYNAFVLNHEAWNPEWLEYDYIGAPYPDTKEVGNGGFSLRSQKFINATKQIGMNKDTTTSDCVYFCRRSDDRMIDGRYIPDIMVEDYGIKFAPHELAERFSLDGHPRVWDGQFGFHSFDNSLTNSDVIRTLRRSNFLSFMSTK